MSPGSCCAQGTAPHSSTSNRWVHCCSKLCTHSLDGCTVAVVGSQAAGLWEGQGTQLAWAETQPCPKQLLPKKWLRSWSLHTNVPSPRVLLCQTMLLFLCKSLAAALYFNWKASTLFLIILVVKLAENFKSGCCSIDSHFSWCLPILFPIIPYVSFYKSYKFKCISCFRAWNIFFLFQLCRTESFHL